MYLSEQRFTADEVRQPGRYVPHRRQIRREHRSAHRHLRTGRAAGEVRFCSRLSPPARGSGEHRAACHVLSDTEQVNHDHLGEQTRPRALLDPEHQQLPRLTRWVRPPRLLPLRCRERRLQIGRRQYRHRPGGPRGRLLHLFHEVRSRAEIPGLDHHPVIGVFQHPGDPLGPRPVSPCIRHEEVRVGSLVASPGHLSSMPLPPTAQAAGCRLADQPSTRADEPRKIFTIRRLWVRVHSSHHSALLTVWPSRIRLLYWLGRSAR